MSYILEALKKSQNERELGQVPTLTGASATDVRRAPGSKTRGLLAVGLAGLALAIALYAALHWVEDQPLAPPSDPATAAAPAGTADSVAGTPATIAAEPQLEPGQQIAAVPVVPGRTRLASADVPQPLHAGGLDAPDVDSPALGEPTSSARASDGLNENAIRGDVPPMARNRRLPRGAIESDPAASVDAEVESSEVDPMEEPPSDDWMEMDEEIGPAEPAEPPPPVPARDARTRRTRVERPTLPEPEVVPIPDDLRQDVEAFKDQIRRERSGAAPRPDAKKAEPEDPKKLRLPLEIESRLPAFFMTAHLYDTDASKRFVVINALKYSPGDTTREGLTVEDILPDGVVLSFEGNRFYRRR